MSELTNAKSTTAGDYEVTDRFERFSQANDVFSRSFWDETIRTEKTDRFYATYRRPLEKWRKANGFTQVDYAVRNAAWHVADLFAEWDEANDRRDGFLTDLAMLREGPEEKASLGDPTEAAANLKKVAQTFGADLVGITATDERWQYTERFSAASGAGVPNVDLAGLDSVIVIGQAMDLDLIQTAPSALAGAATGLGYSEDALVLLATAQFIRNLGYQAVPSMNDTALAIPYALEAGLGEYARNGLVITEELGPRLRLGKIFTDLPLAKDTPNPIGVTEFCQQCDRCVAACPAKAIPAGEPSEVVLNRSGLVGVRKWSVDGEGCFNYWSKINTDCAICVRVCPFNRDYSRRRNRLWQRLALGRGRRLALWLHDRFNGGARRKPKLWWPGSQLAIGLLIGAGLIAAGCGDAAATEANVVGMLDNRFAPLDVDATVGVPIEFRNDGRVDHNVIDANGAFDSRKPSGNQTPDQAWTFTPTAPGTYAFYCSLHAIQNNEGEWEGMVGTLTVTAAKGVTE